MIDRVKVSKGLEICKSPQGRCAECPYNDGEIDFTNCTSILCGDALALLKEQEAVEPVKLVRCKNCKHCDSERIDKNMIWCKIHQFGRPDDYYCADGIEK